MSKAMRHAEEWLRERGGTGIIDRYGRVVASGEAAGQFDAATWLRLVGGRDRCWLWRAIGSIWAPVGPGARREAHDFTATGCTLPIAYQHSARH